MRSSPTAVPAQKNAVSGVTSGRIGAVAAAWAAGAGLAGAALAGATLAGVRLAGADWPG